MMTHPVHASDRTRLHLRSLDHHLALKYVSIFQASCLFSSSPITKIGISHPVVSISITERCHKICHRVCDCDISSRAVHERNSRTTYVWLLEGYNPDSGLTRSRSEEIERFQRSGRSRFARGDQGIQRVAYDPTTIRQQRIHWGLRYLGRHASKWRIGDAVGDGWSLGRTHKYRAESKRGSMSQLKSLFTPQNPTHAIE